MTAIIDLQRRLAEVGRIRIGQQVPTQSGKTRPAKLESFRLTSADRRRIDAAADLYGGAVAEWESPAGRQWEVVTDSDSLDVIVPPSDLAFSQAYEQWSAGGCQVRCDGRWDSIGDKPCHCDPDMRACDIHTRLSVMLRDLPGVGVWRIDSSGYYAAVELAGAVQVLAAAAGKGVMLPARLRLDQRTVKRDGQTRRFAVPVLDVDVTPGQLLGGGAGQPVAIVDPSESGPPQLETPELRHLTPVPETVEVRPVASIADQAKAPEEAAGARRSRSAPIPATGLRPRTADDAQGDQDAWAGRYASRPHPTTPTPDEEAWERLADALNYQPTDSDTMAVLEDHLRSLYATMEAVGLWPVSSSGEDALHAALRKHADAAHVGDLRKADLVAFTERSFDAARTRWQEASA